MSAPRPLTFASVAEAPAEAERLRAGGYRARGNWDLRQICEHLADWLDFEIDGYPPTPLFLRPVLWVMRHTVAPRGLRKSLARGTMAAGLPTAPETVHEPTGDRAGEGASIERLRASAARFLGHEGEYAPSPLFGALDRETTRRMHALHCAHHLGFLEPTDDRAG